MKTLLYICLLALVPLSTIAQKIKWHTTTINFGTVADWNSPPATFQFANTGNKPLMLLPQRHDRTVLVRYPNRAIAPGQTGEIQILYYTGETGAFTKTVSVYSNASHKAEKLTLRGNIKSIYANALTSCPSFQTPAPVKTTEPNVVQVVDAASNLPIPNARVEVYNRGIRKTINTTNLDGVAVNWVEPGKYVAIASKKGYQKAEQELAFTKRNRTAVVYLSKTPNLTEDYLEKTIATAPNRWQEPEVQEEEVDLGITTNILLEEDSRKLAQNEEAPVQTEFVNRQTPANQPMAQSPVVEEEEFDLGISLNDQWDEPTTAKEEAPVFEEETAEQEIDLGIRTNNQFDEQTDSVVTAQQQAQIEREVEAALARFEAVEEKQSPPEAAVTPEPEFSSKKYRPNNVLLLLDVSGSMKDEAKMEKLKAAIRRLVMMLREVDVLTMIAYNSTSWEVLPPTPVTQNAHIAALVDSLHPFGYTNGVKGMKSAYESLEQQLIPGGNNQLIIATDGKFNSSKFSEKDAVQLVKDNSDKGIVLSIIGFGDDKEASRLMKKLAKLGEGSFLQVKTNEDPTELLAEEIKNRSRFP